MADMGRNDILFTVSDTPAPEMVLAVDEGLGLYKHPCHLMHKNTSDPQGTPHIQAGT